MEFVDLTHVSAEPSLSNDYVSLTESTLDIIQAQNTALSNRGHYQFSTRIP